MNCRICGNSGESEQFHVREMMFGLKDEFTYFQCSECECLQISKIPVDISKYYPSTYYTKDGAPVSQGLRKILVWLRNNYAVSGNGILGSILYNRHPNLMLSPLQPLKLKKDACILDVGCGVGTFLHLLRETGFQNILGVDPFVQDDFKLNNGVQILKKYISEVDTKHDLVTFHHSFEHVPDPLETLKHVFRVLNPDGMCMIRVPTVSSFAWNHYREDWVQLDAPRHYYLHSVESMRRLAEMAGMDLFDIVYDSTAEQFMGSEQYMKDIPLFDEHSYVRDLEASIFSHQDQDDYAKRAIELNDKKQGDQAIFYMRKKK